MKVIIEQWDETGSIFVNVCDAAGQILLCWFFPDLDMAYAHAITKSTLYEVPYVVDLKW